MIESFNYAIEGVIHSCGSLCDHFAAIAVIVGAVPWASRRSGWSPLSDRVRAWCQK
jgi:hypothetical protein